MRKRQKSREETDRKKRKEGHILNNNALDIWLRKEGIFLFNDALNTFYLRLYGVKTYGK